MTVTVVPSALHELAVDEDQLVGGQVVDAEVLRDGLDHMREAAAHHGQFVTEPFERAHQGARPRRQEDAVRHGAQVSLS